MAAQSVLAILGGRGDTKLTWDPNDPADCQRMRETVAALKGQGFTFFLTDNTPADELSGDPRGTLIVRKLEPAEVVPDPDDERPYHGAAPSSGCLEEDEPAPAPKRRGRPPKVKTEGQNVVAVRPVRGG